MTDPAEIFPAGHHCRKFGQFGASRLDGTET
jgi:hypothetical protein